MVPVPVYLKKCSDAIDNDVGKKTVYNELVKRFNAMDTSKLVNKADYNAKIKNTEDEIPSITDLSTTAALNVKINQVKD